jgi:hypothetical protein
MLKVKNRAVVNKTEVTEIEDDAFLASAPVDKETLKKVYDYENEYTQNLTNVAVDRALETFKEGGDVESIDITAPYRLDETITASVRKDDGAGTPSVMVFEERDNKLRDEFKKLEGKLEEALK